VIGRFDANQLLRLGEGVDQGFEFSGRGELIARTADEKLGLGGSAQEIVIVDAIVFSICNGDGGQSQGDEGGDAIVVIGGAEADGGSEGKSGEDDGEREFGLDPIESGADVFDFADAVGVHAFTQSCAAEVEAEDRESEAIEGFHGVEDDFVVERSAKERMRVTDDGSVGCGGGSGVEQSFQASGGAGDGEGADAGSFGRHGIKGTTCEGSVVGGQKCRCMRCSLVPFR